MRLSLRLRLPRVQLLVLVRLLVLVLVFVQLLVLVLVFVLVWRRLRLWLRLRLRLRLRLLLVRLSDRSARAPSDRTRGRRHRLPPPAAMARQSRRRSHPRSDHRRDLGCRRRRWRRARRAAVRASDQPPGQFPQSRQDVADQRRRPRHVQKFHE